MRTRDRLLRYLASLLRPKPASPAERVDVEALSVFHMVGKEGQVRTPLGQGITGTVLVEGELWQAQLLARDGADLPPELEPGYRVRVVGQDGLKLLVEPVPGQTRSPWE